MRTFETPIFSNTCGKLFADKVIFASALRETEIDTNKIRNVSFTGNLKISSLFFLALPALLVAFPFVFFHESELFLKAVVAFTGAVLLIISAVKAQRHYRLRIKLKNGETITWNVWQGNMREADKFVRHVQARLKTKP